MVFAACERAPRDPLPVRAAGPVFERIPGRRAEALDSVVYAMAVCGLVRADLLRRENELRAIVSAPVLPAVIRSAWMDRG